MSHDVEMTDRAFAEMEAAYQWWAENRSAWQADRWYNACAEAVNSLANRPDRFPLARENDRFPIEIRESHFGIGRRRTHRVVFTIRPDKVLVLNIRHLAQRDLTPDDR
jgi:plasmid stabilization system protein ParE